MERPMRVPLVVGLILVLALPLAAFADDEMDDLPPAPLPTEPLPEEEETPAEAPPAPDTTRLDDEAPTRDAEEPGLLSPESRRTPIDSEDEARYHEAFDLLVEDRPAEAAALLRTILPRLEGTERESAAAALLQLAEARSGHLTLEPPALLGTTEGRYAFVTWTTLGSIATGIKLGIMLDLFDPRANVLLVMATTGTGLAASLLATRDMPLTPATASLFRTGLIAGSWTALHLGLIAELRPEPVAGLMIVGSGLGGAAGFLAGRATGLATGSASLVGSSFFWGSVIGILMLPVIEPFDGRVVSAVMLGGSIAGLAAGATAASRVDISRTRVLLMDLGGLVGGLALGGLGIVLFIDQPAAWAPRVIPSMAIAGILGGASTSLWLTRNLDESGGGGGLGTHGSLVGLQDGRWSLGVPAPTLLPAADRGRAPGLGVSLVSGSL